MRADIHELKAPRSAAGRGQQGKRLAVVLQSDDLPLSTLIVAPTSASAQPRIFRPSIEVGPVRTCVLLEQATAVDHTRLGRWAGRVSLAEMQEIDAALLMVFGLD